jgi:hypothetical protein
MAERELESLKHDGTQQNAHEGSLINRLADEWNESSTLTKAAVGTAAAVGALALGRIAWARMGAGAAEAAGAELSAMRPATAALVDASIPISQMSRNAALDAAIDAHAASFGGYKPMTEAVVLRGLPSPATEALVKAGVPINQGTRAGASELSFERLLKQ